MPARIARFRRDNSYVNMRYLSVKNFSEDASELHCENDFTGVDNNIVERHVHTSNVKQKRKNNNYSFRIAGQSEEEYSDRTPGE